MKGKASLSRAGAANMAGKFSSHMQVMELGILSWTDLEIRHGEKKQLVQVKMQQVSYQSNCTSGHTDIPMDSHS